MFEKELTCWALNSFSSEPVPRLIDGKGGGGGGVAIKTII